MSAWRDHSSVSSPNGALPEGNLSGLPPLIVSMSSFASDMTFHTLYMDRQICTCLLP